MFLFSAQQNIPYSCSLQPITTPALATHWCDSLGPTCARFKQHIEKDKWDREIPLWEGLHTLMTCLQSKTPMVKYVSCLTKRLPEGTYGPEELVMIMGVFTQHNCPLAFHMGVSRTYKFYSKRREHNNASQFSTPASIIMHVLTAQEVLERHPEIVYTLTLPVAKMMSILNTHLSPVFSFGYREQPSHLERLITICRQNSDQSESVTTLQFATINQQLHAKSLKRNVPVLSIPRFRQDGTPEEIHVTMPNNSITSFNREKHPWLFENPFCMNCAQPRISYVVMPTEDLAHQTFGLK